MLQLYLENISANSLGSQINYALSMIYKADWQSALWVSIFLK